MSPRWVGCWQWRSAEQGLKNHLRAIPPGCAALGVPVGELTFTYFV